jgi:hypothetical protein
MATRYLLVDPKTVELAEHVLQDEAASDLTPRQRNRRTRSLAATIQDAIEHWTAVNRVREKAQT